MPFLGDPILQAIHLGSKVCEGHLLRAIWITRLSALSGLGIGDYSAA